LFAPIPSGLTSPFWGALLQNDHFINNEERWTKNLRYRVGRSWWADWVFPDSFDFFSHQGEKKCLSGEDNFKQLKTIEFWKRDNFNS